MYDRVIFYNHFGFGDIFESREFVKECMKIVEAREYFYSHGKNNRLLLDIKQLQYKDITEHMNPTRGIWDDLNGNLYINTWIGRDGKYVLPGIGCTVEKLYEMYNDLLYVYALGSLSGTPIDYIPKIDYKCFYTKEINKFFSNTKSKDCVFIDNGLVQSMQAHNFEFNPIIVDLADAYQDKLFITTHEIKDKGPNLFYTRDIIGKELGCDLNEVSYISLFCSTLIGRNSGPHVHTQVLENVMNESKKLLSFTYHQQGSSFVVNADVKIGKYWSPHTAHDDVLRKCKEVIDG